MTTDNDLSMPLQHDLKHLEAIIYVFGINKRMWSIVDEFLQSAEHGEASQLCLATIINGFGLNLRAWEILDQRFGFQNRSSLDEVAVSLGNVTRERVRQIQIKALEKVKPGIHRIIMPLFRLDEQISKSWPAFEDVTTINEAIFVYQTLLVDTGWEIPQGKEIRQLLLLIRALVHAKSLNIDSYLPHLSYAACRLSPPIVKHPRIAEQEHERRHQQMEMDKKWTYEKLAEVVLEEASMPLHYMEIARRAEDLGRRDSFTLKAIHNVLYANPVKFAYVDQGTYGLTSWGLTSVDSYTDIVAEVLSTEGKSLPFGNILQSVNSRRTVKYQTLQMTLDMNPRFYYSQEGTYGLRAWLLPRERQTLRTPKWQVETPQSYERVERATERGYDIDMIMSQDRA